MGIFKLAVTLIRNLGIKHGLNTLKGVREATKMGVKDLKLLKSNMGESIYRHKGGAGYTELSGTMAETGEKASVFINSERHGFRDVNVYGANNNLLKYTRVYRDCVGGPLSQGIYYRFYNPKVVHKLNWQ